MKRKALAPLLDSMAISEYHKKSQQYSDSEIQERADCKEKELEAVFDKAPLKTGGDVVSVAVLGCIDKRYIRQHKRIFEKLLKRPVELTTFDITIEHLEGGSGVIQHDCTKPLPKGHFDITFAHVFLIFIPTEKQIEVIRNAYQALEKDGLSLFVLDREDYEEPDRDKGYFVPLERWEDEMIKEGIDFQYVPNKYGKTLVLSKMEP
jgi:hypothetical protein